MWFKGFLIWYQKTHLRARRLSTFESVWKWLRQVYYDTYYKVIAKDVGEEITNVCYFQCIRIHMLDRP